MPEVAVRTLKHDITIRTNGEAEFDYLAGVPEVADARTWVTIDIGHEGPFFSAAWHGIVPAFLARVASARDLASQIDSELAELSILDARPGMVLASSLLAWRGKRLLVLGPPLSRTALAMALFSSKVDIEGNWACRLSASRFTALPRSVRWGTSLFRAYPETREMTAEVPAHEIDSGHGHFWAWCPVARERPWCCRDGTVDGIVVADSMAGGCSLSRRLASEMVWGHLMAARISGDGGLPAAMALKRLAASAPAIGLSVGDLAGAQAIALEFLAELT